MTALLLLAAAGLLAVMALAWSDRSAAEVPTARVELTEFVRKVPAEGYLRSVRANDLVVPSAVNGPVRIAWIVEDGSAVAAGDVVVRLDPSGFEERLTQARDDRVRTGLETSSERATSRADLANLDRDAELARLELDAAERFQKKDETIFSRSEIIESEIDGELADHRRRHAEASKSDRQRLSRTELELLGIRRRQAERKIGAAEESLEALELTAPDDGILVLKSDRRGNPPRVGDTTWAGQTLAQLPDLTEMEAEVWVLEADAGGLEAGKSAEVVVEAHPDRSHRATISRVDKVARPRRRGSPVQYFSVVLALESTDPKTMKPGQRVAAKLLAEERSAALTVPRQAIFEGDDGPLIYRRAAGAFEPVEVEVLSTFLGKAVVRGTDPAPVAEGDVVALRDPTAAEPRALERTDGGGSGVLPNE
ncbi:MAG: HlyD family efflux transporter periplasmic adaptor subunit [Acidobacteriota bacterium]